MSKLFAPTASVFFNGDFYRYLTMSDGGIRYVEPSAPVHYLPPDASDQLLGATLRLSLSASKKLNGSFKELFESGIVQRLGEERDRDAMKEYGYKNKRAMYINMDSCDVILIGDDVKIQPCHHDSLDGYSAKKSGPEPIIISATSTDEELGTALKIAFGRCTSSWGK